MQTRTVLAAILVVLAAGAAAAQDPPSLPAPTDPVAVGRSELSGKVYGAVDFGGRISHVDGDEARFQRYRDLRSGIYGTNMLAGRRTAGLGDRGAGLERGLSRSALPARRPARRPAVGDVPLGSDSAVHQRRHPDALHAAGRRRCSASRTRRSRRSRAARRPCATSKTRRWASS